MGSSISSSFHGEKVASIIRGRGLWQRYYVSLFREFLAVYALLTWDTTHSVRANERERAIPHKGLQPVFFFLPYFPPLSLLLPFLFLSLVAHLSPLRVPLSFLLSFLRARSVARARARDISLSLGERVRERSKAGGRWWRIKSTRRSNNSCTTVTSVGTYAYMSVQARRTRSSPQRGKGSSYRKNAWYASCHFFVGGYFSFFRICWFFDRAARGSVFATLPIFVAFVSTRRSTKLSVVSLSIVKRPIRAAVDARIRRRFESTFLQPR